MEFLFGVLDETGLRHLNRNLTPEEWRRYMGNDLPYRKTCPNLSVSGDTKQSEKR
jgi:hypothetical protein